MTVLVPTCPECGSTRTWKDGTRQTENGFEFVCTTPDEIMLFRKRK